jgi:predicted enzyme related to lactoylglutathione lyase
VRDEGVLRAVDAVTVPVPDLEEGLRFYRDGLGHAVLWRDDDRGQVGLALPESSTELVLTLQHGYEPDWLVASVPDAVVAVIAAGGRVLSPPADIPVGRVAVVADPFGNPLVLLDLSKGCYDLSKGRYEPAPPAGEGDSAPR